MEVQATGDPSGVRAVAPLGQTGAGGSQPFLVRADDECRYWCKALNNPQGARVPINEQIVGRLGSAIGVGVCMPMLVEIPSDLVGYKYTAGYELEEGWVHGSRAVDGTTETRTLDHRGEDDNPTRHAGFLALHEWLFGGDGQWLVLGEEDNKYFSHDHGHYFAGQGGPDWTIQGLQQNPDADAAELLEPGGQGLDSAELSRLADVLEALTAEDIASHLAKLPATWPVSNEELSAVGEFADARREAVASRLRERVHEEDEQ